VELQYNVEREGLAAVPTTDYHAIVEANAAKIVPQVWLNLAIGNDILGILRVTLLHAQAKIFLN
jgi:hypothetical protein